MQQDGAPFERLAPGPSGRVEGARDEAAARPAPAPFVEFETFAHAAEREQRQRLVPVRIDVIRPQRDRGVVVGERGVEALQRLERDGAAVVGLGVPGRALQCDLVALQRLGVAAEFAQRVAAVHQRVDESAVELLRTLVRGDGVGVAAQALQRVAAIEMGGGQAGLQLQCPVVIGERVDRALEGEAREAAVVVRFRVVGAQRERAAVARQRVLVAPRLAQHVAEVEMRRGGVRPRGHGALQERRRIGEPCRASGNDAEQVERVEVVGLRLEHRTAQLLGARQVAGVVGGERLLHGLQHDEGFAVRVQAASTGVRAR